MRNETGHYEITTKDGTTYQIEPEARTRCEVWTRVMGYHRPISSFNPGKQAEYAERRFFQE